MSCFHHLAFINKAGMNTHTQIFGWIEILISLGYTVSSMIAGSYNYMLRFLGNCQTIFQRICTIFISHKSVLKILDRIWYCHNFLS